MNELNQQYGGGDDTSDSGSDDHMDLRGSSTASISRGIYGMGGVSSIMRGSGTTASTKESVRGFADRCKHIPMRLTEDERRLLSVLENALEVCEYTDVVDVTFSHTRKSKQSRIFDSLVDLLSIACGLLMSNNLTKGETLLSEKTLNDNVPLFAQIFEIGRRYKIMNPGKMRDTYGKLMFMLMDTESYQVKQELKLDFIRPILTVGVFLADRGAEDLLSDPLLPDATCAIDHSGEDNTPGEIAALTQKKTEAAQQLLARYAGHQLPREDLQRVLDSISDNQAYLSFNVAPVQKAIDILLASFNPRQPQDPFSLQLTSKPRKSFGSGGFSFTGFSSRYIGGGAALSHDHATQYTFVLQSLSLWREIMRNMPKLWLLADHDMLSQQYRLCDTGQGYHRLQTCPRVGAEMQRILSYVQRECKGQWVGLSVIHLGDRDVPNALVFIDKYTQVPRILAPIVRCIERLPLLTQDPPFHRYVADEWGSIAHLRLQILSDFFKHGFDGSGDDGGSCIDGRLTSAWNWCSKLHKKPYYHVFMFTGFQGFDGDWKED